MLAPPSGMGLPRGSHPRHELVLNRKAHIYCASCRFARLDEWRGNHYNRRRSTGRRLPSGPVLAGPYDPDDAQYRRASLLGGRLCLGCRRFDGGGRRIFVTPRRWDGLRVLPRDARGRCDALPPMLGSVPMRILAVLPVAAVALGCANEVIWDDRAAPAPEGTGRVPEGCGAPGTMTITGTVDGAPVQIEAPFDGEAALEGVVAVSQLAGTIAIFSAKTFFPAGDPDPTSTWFAGVSPSRVVTFQPALGASGPLSGICDAGEPRLTFVPAGTNAGVPYLRHDQARIAAEARRVPGAPVDAKLRIRSADFDLTGTVGGTSFQAMLPPSESSFVRGSWRILLAGRRDLREPRRKQRDLGHAGGKPGPARGVLCRKLPDLRGHHGHLARWRLAPRHLCGRDSALGLPLGVYDARSLKGAPTGVRLIHDRGSGQPLRVIRAGSCDP